MDVLFHRETKLREGGGPKKKRNGERKNIYWINVYIDDKPTSISFGGHYIHLGFFVRRGAIQADDDDDDTCILDNTRTSFYSKGLTHQNCLSVDRLKPNDPLIPFSGKQLSVRTS